MSHHLTMRVIVSSSFFWAMSVTNTSLSSKGLHDRWPTTPAQPSPHRESKVATTVAFNWGWQEPRKIYRYKEALAVQTALCEQLLVSNTTVTGVAFISVSTQKRGDEATANTRDQRPISVCLSVLHRMTSLFYETIMPHSSFSLSLSFSLSCQTLSVLPSNWLLRKFLNLSLLFLLNWCQDLITVLWALGVEASWQWRPSCGKAAGLFCCEKCTGMCDTRPSSGHH